MSQKGQGLVEYALILVVVAILTVLALMIFDDFSTIHKFDQNFAANPNLINATIIPVGADSLYHPTATIPIDVPTGRKYFEVTPRLWEFSGCLEKRLESDMKYLHAAVPLPPEAATVANLITIQMPIPGGQVINICGPKGMTLKIILWYD